MSRTARRMQRRRAESSSCAKRPSTKERGPKLERLIEEERLLLDASEQIYSLMKEMDADFSHDPAVA